MNIAIIGCGNISGAYLKLAPMFKALNMVAVADINPAAAQARAAEYPVRALSVEQLLAADDIDIVVNLTIPKAHFEVSKQILTAGKHVYSEKPLVLSYAEGQELAQLAQSQSLRIGSAPDTFFGSSHQAARRLVDEGAIGEVIGGSCYVMSHGMEHWHPNPDFFFAPGGGPILDLGPYYLTNLVQLIGPISAVTAMASTAFPTRTINNGARRGETIEVATPTNIQALLEFANGAVVNLGASWDVWAHRHHEMELYGKQGSLYIPDPNFFGGDIIKVNPQAETTTITSSEHPFARNNFELNTATPRANYRCAGLADMAQAIEANQPHRCSLELALHVVEVMQAILLSASERRWREISSTCTRPEALNANAAQALLKD